MLGVREHYGVTVSEALAWVGLVSDDGYGAFTSHHLEDFSRVDILLDLCVAVLLSIGEEAIPVEIQLPLGRQELLEAVLLLYYCLL